MKTNFQKICAALTVTVFSVLTPTVAAFALDPTATKGILGNTISTAETLTPVATTIIQWILGITFTFAVIMIIIGGFRYVASAGNEDQAEAAKETITKAIIGLIIIILAYVILSTVQTIITGGSSGCSSGSQSGAGDDEVTVNCPPL